MKIQISDNFTYLKLIKFTIPSIIMMIITSVYSIVDGIFVSNFVGEIEFAALNLIYPIIMITSAFGFMVGTGGCALIAKNLGEGNKKKANETFSMLIAIIIIVSVIISTLGIIFIKPISLLLGATPQLLQSCIVYGSIMLAAIPGFMLQVAFMMFVVVANKPNMGMILSIISGITNVVLDFVLIVVLDFGLAGAAIATGFSQILGGIIPLCYFLNKNNSSSLHLCKFKWDFKAFLNSCSNGASEMMTSISKSFVDILYNLQLMLYLGANGVSAYGIIMYVSFVFSSVFIGYSIGASPIISYNYGANNKVQLQSLFKKSLILLSVCALVLTAIAEIFARPLAAIFVSYNADLLELSTRAFRLFSLSYLFSSINAFASSFFTALNNGKVSAAISFLRTLVFQAAFIMLLPIILGIDGIWLAVVFAEIICLGISIAFFAAKNKQYGYIKSKKQK